MEKHGGNIHKIELEYGVGREEIFDYSSNINPLGVSEKLQNEIIKNLNLMRYYPDPGYEDLRKTLAQYHSGVSAHNILVGNGATELIYLYARTVQAKQALILAPTFSEYETALRQTGTHIQYFELREENGFEPDMAALKREMEKAYDLVVLCNPNNPTGLFLELDTIKEILSLADSYGSRVFIDESFIEFINSHCEKSALLVAAEFPGCFILRSLTKFFAIPGLRLGYAVSYDTSLNGDMRQNQEPWTVNVFADLAAAVLLNDTDYIHETAAFIQQEKDYLYNALRGIDWLKPYEPSVNFILVQILNDQPAAAIQKELLTAKILIRDASNFKFLNEKYIRLAVKDRPANEFFLENIARIFTTVS
ncbi:MAG: threonine-phosphate decarboxylase [bacterium]|nr:threonine-phosphate decarboxylase [bacterium]